MAERRMISKSISVSERVNGLSDTFHMLLFTWMVPHADDFGRLFGSPMKVKALVVPMLDKTFKEVEEALSSLHRQGLIQWYEVGGNQYIQIDKFDRHQTGLHKRTKSKFPDPPGNSGNFPEIPLEEKRTEQNRREEKRKEQNGKEESPAADDSFQFNPDDPFVFYQNNFGVINPFISQQMDEWCKDLGDDLVLEAMKRALSQNKRTWSYVNSILKSWHSKGIKTIEQANAEQAEFDRQRQTQRPGGRQVLEDKLPASVQWQQNQKGATTKGISYQDWLAKKREEGDYTEYTFTDFMNEAGLSKDQKVVGGETG